MNLTAGSHYSRYFFATNHADSKSMLSSGCLNSPNSRRSATTLKALVESLAASSLSSMESEM